MSANPMIAALRDLQQAYRKQGGREPAEIRLSRDMGERLMDEVRAHLVIRYEPPFQVARGGESFWWARVDGLDVLWPATPVALAPGKVGYV